MTREEVLKKVRAIVVEVTEFPEEKIDDNDNFIDDLGIESVMAVGIVSKVEKLFQMDIPPDRFGDLDCVASIVDIILDVAPS